MSKFLGYPYKSCDCEHSALQQSNLQVWLDFCFTASLGETIVPPESAKCQMLIKNVEMNIDTRRYAKHNKCMFFTHFELIVMGPKSWLSFYSVHVYYYDSSGKSGIVIFTEILHGLQFTVYSV